MKPRTKLYWGLIVFGAAIMIGATDTVTVNGQALSPTIQTALSAWLLVFGAKFISMAFDGVL